MVLLLPIDSAIRPSKRSDQAGGNGSRLPTIRCLDLDARDTAAESGKTLRLVEGNEDVSIVVFVHPCLDDPGNFKSLDVRDHRPRHGIHLRTAGRKKRDAVSHDPVESRREQVAEDRASALT